MPGNPVETRTRGSIRARAVRARRCARELIGGRSVGGVASRVVGRSRTVVDAEYLEPPGLAGSPRGCVPVPGRANHRGEPRRSPRATPQPRPRSPPVPSREGRTRGVGGRARCDGRGARRHRRRRRRRHRGRSRGTPIRPCVSRARALSDARRVVEIQQRRGQSRASRFKKIPQPIESLKIWRAVLTCQVLSWTYLAAVSKRPEVKFLQGRRGRGDARRWSGLVRRPVVLRDPHDATVARFVLKLTLERHEPGRGIRGRRGRIPSEQRRQSTVCDQKMIDL